MNAGVDLFTLMGQVTLPPELDIPQGHGKVPWIVRAVWEEHSGWFRYESTTELYDVPPSAIWSELTELAGRHRRAARRAPTRTSTPVARSHALHFVDMVLAESPDDVDALRGEARSARHAPRTRAGARTSARSAGWKPRSATRRRRWRDAPAACP